jgi:hypothetical protein
MVHNIIQTCLVAVTVFGVVTINKPAISKPNQSSDQKAITEFRKKTQKINTFLSNRPIFLSNADFPDSPTGRTYNHNRFILNNISINVEKTNSLTTPLIGYMYVNYQLEDNNHCGDLNGYGYSTREKAIAHRTDCFFPWILTGTEPRGEEKVEIIFAYQEGKWLFKDVWWPFAHKSDTLLMTAFGKPSGAWIKMKEDNRAWENVIK